MKNLKGKDVLGLLDISRPKDAAERGDTLHFTAPRGLGAVTVGMTVPFGRVEI